MSEHGKGRKLLKKVGKKLLSRAKDEAVGYVEDKIKDRSRDQRRKYSKKTTRVGSLPRHLQPDISVSKKFKLGGKKKARQKKKIKKWKAEAAAGKVSEQAKFLAMDKKNK